MLEALHDLFFRAPCSPFLFLILNIRFCRLGCFTCSWGVGQGKRRTVLSLGAPPAALQGPLGPAVVEEGPAWALRAGGCCGPRRVVLLTPELSFRAWASGAMERPHVLAVRWKSGQVLEHVGSSRNWFPDYPGNIEDSALRGALGIEECTPCQSETRSTNCPRTGPIFSCASCC